MDELMTIGAFAKRTGLSISALRFYASEQVLVPAEVDATSGYRRYAEEQVSDAVLVRDLRRLEMPLREIALALTRSEPERKELVETQLRRLEDVVRRAHDLARTMGVANRPQEKPMSATMSATLPAVDLSSALDQVLPAAGTDPERPHLMGVLVEGKAGSLRLVATDSHRLAVRDLVPSQLDHDFAAVVPAATLAGWRTKIAEQDEVALSLDDAVLAATADGIVVTAEVLPVTFPDYEPFLEPAEDATAVRVDRLHLVGALASSNDGHARLATSEGSLHISQGGEVVEIVATGDGPDQEVTIDSRYATDAARNAVGAEVIIEISDPVSPVLFRSADDGTFTSRIMPIKLD